MSDPQQPEGIKFDSGKPRFELIPPEVLEKIAHLYTLGAKKYGDNNWAHGMKWSRVYGALLRHVHAAERGTRWNLESTGITEHLVAAAWNCFTLMMYEQHGLGEDDRLCTIVVSPEYIAGLLDADGWFCVGQRSCKSNKLGIALDAMIGCSMTTREPLDKLAIRYGGKVQGPRKLKNPNAKPQYRWVVRGTQKVEAVLFDVLPYLVIKREQAEVLQQFALTMRPKQQKGHKKNLLSEHIIKERFALKQRLHILNQRGLKPYEMPFNPLKEKV
jgi:hypothetical protein